jgi:N-carbamoylputrescine amidase
MTQITVAALQLAFTADIDRNIAEVSRLVREAAAQGAQVILPPELFEGEYFCRVEDEGLFANAKPTAEHKAVRAMQALASELKVHIPTSFFEADGPHHYNSLAMINPDGQVAGVYRKSHIPDGPGYEEKFYFRPGNTGFKVGRPGDKLGVGICWDQWYPETARAMMLMGAEILFYPTAIGSEPHDDSLDTARLWRRAMVGHAVSNVVPIVAANRGCEHGQTFYGTSFICDERGDILAELDREEEGVIVATLDIDRVKRHRAAFGFFRDRRPELYGGWSRISDVLFLPRRAWGGAGSSPQGQRPFEHRLEHGGGQSPGILVVARAVIAIEHHRPAAGQAVLGQMREPRLGQAPAQRLDDRSVRDLAQRDDDRQPGQRGEFLLQEGAAGADFVGRRLVLGRQALDRVQDHRAVQRQAVIDPRVEIPLGQPEPGERAIEQRPGAIAGKGAAGAMRAMLAGGQADDRQPRIGIAEGRHGAVPPAGIFGGDRVADFDQAGA